MVPKIRKPVIVKEWFGITTSSDDSDIEHKDWSEVDRRKRSNEKKERRKKRKENLKSECATRAAHMCSIGPISIDSVEFFRRKGQNFEVAKVSAFKEFLHYNLNYTEDELLQLKVEETRLSTKGDKILNVALAEEDEIKELFIRKAESRNENIILRNYIPPNFHERFMELNRICADKRKDDPSLKTQLRFGRKDIELYMKIRGEDKGFRRVSLYDFTDMSAVPGFNFDIKWKRYQDKPPRRATNIWADPGQRPSTIRQSDPGKKQLSTSVNTSDVQIMDTGSEDPSNRQDSVVNPLIRSNSNTTTSVMKKHKLYSADSSGEEEYLSGSEDKNQKFATPTGSSKC